MVQVSGRFFFFSWLKSLQAKGVKKQFQAPLELQWQMVLLIGFEILRYLFVSPSSSDFI